MRIRTIAYGIFVLTATWAFSGSDAVAQAMECSSSALLQDLQRQLQRSYAPRAIDSISAIGRGEQPVSARVEILSIDTISQTSNIQKCSASARISRFDLLQSINVTARYTIYNRSTTGGFDVEESR